MQPIILQGRQAFSDFRLTALTNALNKALASGGTTAAVSSAALEPTTPDPIASIDAVECYFIESKGPLDDMTTERAFALLNAKQHFSQSGDLSAVASAKVQGGFFVTPRKGTISPWSTKATDIFHNCALSDILRVERGIHLTLTTEAGLVLGMNDLGLALLILHDRMTEAVYDDVSDFFQHLQPAPLRTVPLMAEGPESFYKANVDWGLAMSPEEIDYLVAAYQKMERDPTDAELVMFSQVNSEHCRHKIFNADWIVDGEKSERSLFKMIRNTHALNPEGVLVAYSDNSGVLEGFPAEWWEVNQSDGSFRYQKTASQLDIL